MAMPKEGQLVCSHRVWQAYKKPKKPKKEKISDVAVCPGDPDALATYAISTTHLANVYTAELEEAQCDPRADLCSGGIQQRRGKPRHRR